MDENKLDLPLLKSYSGATNRSIPIDKMDQIMKDLNSWNPCENQIYRGHEGAVWSTLSTSDNDYIFSGSEDKSIIIWDATTGLQYGKLEGHTKVVNALALAIDEKYLISGAWDSNIKIWDWRNKAFVGSLVGHTEGIYCMAVTQDSKTLVSGAGDYKVRIWNVETRTEETALDCDNSSVFSLALTSDDNYVISGGFDGKIRIWNLKTRLLHSIHNGNAGIIQSLAVTNDNNFLIFGTRDNIVKVWNFADKSEYFTFNVHTNWIRNLVTTFDSNYFITASADKTMRIVNLREKEEKFNLEGHEGFVFGLFLSKNGQFLLSGSSDNTLRKWEIGKPYRATQLKGHKMCVTAISVTSDNNYIVSGSVDKTVRIWSIESKSEISCMNGHTDAVWGVCVTDDNKYIASVSADLSLKIWNFDERREEFTLSGHEKPIYCVAVSHDGKLAVSGGQDKALMIWNLEDRVLKKKLEGHTDTVFTVKVSQDNKYAFSGSPDLTIRIWDLEMLVLLNKIETKSGRIESLALNYEEKLLVLGDRNNEVHLWDWERKSLKKKFTLHTKWVKCVAFASDGNLIASCSNDYTIVVWNANEERQEFVLRGHSNEIRSVAFSSNRKYIVSGSLDWSVRLWDLENIQNLELADHGSPLDSFLYLSYIKQQKPLNPSIINTVFSSLKINLVHVCCYFGYDKYLKNVLQSGALIITDTEGHSPFYYAVSRNIQSCVDVVLEFMIDVSEKNDDRFIQFCHALRDDLYSIIRNTSEFTFKFLSSIFYVVDKDMPNLGSPINQLPAFKFSKLRVVDPYAFVLNHTEAVDKTEILIEFKTTVVPISLENGSINSLTLLESIQNCSRLEILQTDLIRYIIDLKWNSYWWLVFAQTALIWLNLLLMTLLIVLSYNLWLSLLFVLVNFFLLIYEAIQLKIIGWIEYFDFWNTIDVVRIFLTSVFIIIYYQEIEKDEFFDRLVLWLMVIFSFLRGITGFRAFKPTRYYIRLIFRSFYESISFLIIFFYSTFAFGVIYYTSLASSEASVFNQLWVSPFNLNMGSFGTNYNEFSFEYAFYMMACVSNVIIMLNLLISILGDSFEKFQIDANKLDCMEMIDAIIEFEKLLSWRKIKNERFYLQLCTKKEALESSKDWQGRINKIEKMIELSTEKTIEKVMVIEKNINEKIIGIEENINKKLQQLIKLVSNQ